MLSIVNLHASYDRAPVLEGVTLDVRPAAITALVGSNGAGKTSLLKAIMGAMPKVQGSMTLDGSDIIGLSSAEIVKRGISLVPEGRRIFGPLTVVENLQAGSYPVKDRSDNPQLVEKIFEMFPRLAERRKFLGSSLSGGEQQMLAIGRALMARPKWMLLDEPSMGLAPKVVDQVFASLLALRAEGISVLLVEQNARRALGVAEAAYIIENGRIVLSGAGSELSSNARIADLYLGTV